jgi:hypothetical protein
LTQAADISNLFRKEIELAKAEASEKVDVVLGAAQRLAIGAVLGIAAAGVLLAAIVTGLAAIFVGMGMDPTLANGLRNSTWTAPSTRSRGTRRSSRRNSDGTA